MSWSKPSSELSAHKPEKYLLGMGTIGSIILQTVVQFVFQYYALILLLGDPEYVPIDQLMEDRHNSFSGDGSDEFWED